MAARLWLFKILTICAMLALAVTGHQAWGHEPGDPNPPPLDEYPRYMDPANGEPHAAVEVTPGNWQTSLDALHPVDVCVGTTYRYQVFYYDESVPGWLRLNAVQDMDTWTDPQEYHDYLAHLWNFDGQQADYSYVFTTITYHQFSTLGPKHVEWAVRDMGTIDVFGGYAYFPEANDPPDTGLGWDATGELWLEVMEDSSAPTVAIQDQGTVCSPSNGDNGAITATWTAADAESGIVAYRLAVSTNPVAPLGWTVEKAAYEATGVTSYSGPRQVGQTYYFYVKVKNGQGVWSDPARSDGIECKSVWHVKEGGTGSGLSWSDPLGSVAYALGSAASQGGEVWVAAGETPYYERITLQDGVALYGGFAGTETVREQRDWSANETVLDGQQAGTVVDAPSGLTSSARIDGFTIQGGDSSDRGGGICCSSSPTIANNTISGNSANYDGGGISCVGGSPTVASNIVSGNSTFGYGGGISCYNNSAAVMTNNTISANSAYCDGGGIWCEGSPTVASNIVSGNSTDSSGGGISCYNSAAVMTNNTISGNSANYGGGGIYCEGGSPTVASNIVSRNRASNWGGGIACYYSAATMTNNTISANSTDTSEGGGIWCEGSPTITNNIVAFNSSGLYGSGGSPALRNNCVSGNVEYAYSGSVTPGTGDISDDPRFASREDGNYHIQPYSPCIDAGYDNAVGAGWTDIDGDDRKIDLIPGPPEVDMGADESDGTIWYELLLTSSSAVPLGNDGCAVATVHNPIPPGSDVDGYTVYFSVTGGEFTWISNGQLTSPTTAEGTTSNGSLEVYFSREIQGAAVVKSWIFQSKGVKVERDVRVWFYDPTCAWPMFQHDVSHTGVTDASLDSNLQMLWKKDLEGGLGGTLWSSPIVAYGIVYVGTDAGMLYAFDAIDGSEVVQPVDLGSPIHGTPCVDDGKIYVGTSDGVLHVLYAYELTEEWTKAFPGESITGGVTVVTGDAVYVGTDYGSTGRLHTIDLATHNERVNSPASTQYGVDYTTPALDANFPSGARCYVSDFSCWVTAVQCSDGLWKWEWHRDNSVFYSSPTVFASYIFVGSHVNGMYRIIDGGISAQEPNPYMFTGAGAVINSTAAAWGGKLYFCTDSGNVCCIDAASFTSADWTTNLGAGAITSSPAISAPTELLFTGTESGKIYALDLAGGSPTLVYDTRDDIASLQIKSSPAIAEGRLFIVAGNATGRYLYCFGP